MIREREASEAGLSDFDMDVLKQQIQANIDYAWAGPHDRRFFPVNKQIAEEELRIQNLSFLIRERSLEGVRRGSSYHRVITDAIERTENRCRKRLEVLNELWYEEDKEMRESAGANWEDLWPVLKF